MDATGRRGWAGALLLVAHLVAGVLLPILHVADGIDRSPDHVEPAGTHHGGHGDACVVCRLAESRFAGPPTPVAAASDESVERPPPHPVSEPRIRTAQAPFAARAPPVDHPAG